MSSRLYSFVLLVSTRTIFYLPYSVNVTATNELWEVYKVLISAKTGLETAGRIVAKCDQPLVWAMEFLQKIAQELRGVFFGGPRGRVGKVAVFQCS